MTATDPTTEFSVLDDESSRSVPPAGVERSPTLTPSISSSANDNQEGSHRELVPQQKHPRYVRVAYSALVLAVVTFALLIATIVPQTTWMSASYDIRPTQYPLLCPSGTYHDTNNVCFTCRGCKLYRDSRYSLIHECGIDICTENSVFPEFACQSNDDCPSGTYCTNQRRCDSCISCRQYQDTLAGDCPEQCIVGDALNVVTGKPLSNEPIRVDLQMTLSLVRGTVEQKPFMSGGPPENQLHLGRFEQFEGEYTFMDETVFTSSYSYGPQGLNDAHKKLEDARTQFMILTVGAMVSYAVAVFIKPCMPAPKDSASELERANDRHKWIPGVAWMFFVPTCLIVGAVVVSTRMMAATHDILTQVPVLFDDDASPLTPHPLSYAGFETLLQVTFSNTENFKFSDAAGFHLLISALVISVVSLALMHVARWVRSKQLQLVDV